MEARAAAETVESIPADRGERESMMAKGMLIPSESSGNGITGGMKRGLPGSV